GKGDVTFLPAQSYSLPSRPYSVAAGDFNGDGHLDLAVANGSFSNGNYQNGRMTVLLGKGDGTFQTGRYYTAGYDARSVAVGDFNGDGQLDLAVANGTDSGTLSVLLNKGDGTFQAAQTYVVGVESSSLAVGDFNGDGKL